MKLIKFVVFSVTLFFTLNIHANKSELLEIRPSINTHYHTSESNHIKNIYNKIRLFQDRYYLPPEKNNLFIINELRIHPDFTERLNRNINFLTYDPATNSNSNETLVFTYHISCLLNKGIGPILNTLNTIDIQNETELAVLLFNIWIKELTEITTHKLTYYDFSEQYDNFMVTIIPEINRIENAENSINNNTVFIRQNINKIINYHQKFFGAPSTNFNDAVDNLRTNPSLDADAQHAIAIFNMKSESVDTQGYDLLTNTNIKETFVYLWHLCTLTNDMNPILKSLKSINESMNLTNAAIIFSNELAKLLNIHSLPKTKNPLQINLQKKHIKNANKWMSDSLALQWASQYPTKNIFELKARGFDPYHPFIVNYKLNQVDGINNLTLYHHPRPGGGLCGYLCSSFEGRSPEECLDLLLEHCENPYYIDLMFFDIKSTIWQVDFDRPLQGQLPQSWIEDNYLMGVLLDDYQLKQYLKVNTNLVREYLIGVITGIDFPGIDKTLTYIIHNNNEFTATGIFDALAELGGYNLVIYTSNPENAYDLNINHYHQSPGADKTLHILHRGGHYDLLSKNPWPIEFPVVF